jgi:hypothetical protein
MQSTKIKQTEKVQRDAYYQISVKLVDGFRFKVPARGFNLKSLLDFEKSLDSVAEHSYKEITEKEYDKMINSTWVEEKTTIKKRTRK